MKLAIVGIAQSKFEDGGQALILEVSGPEDTNYEFRLHSWDEAPVNRAHPEIHPKEHRYGHQPLRKYIGKRLLVTVEVVE